MTQGPGPTTATATCEVDTKRSMAVYREWLALTRSAAVHSPDGTRRPYWLKRPLKPTKRGLPDCRSCPKGNQMPRDRNPVNRA